MIPQVVASERGKAQTVWFTGRGCRTRQRKQKVRNMFDTGTGLDRLTIEGESPVRGIEHAFVEHLSRMGHANPV